MLLRGYARFVGQFDEEPYLAKEFGMRARHERFVLEGHLPVERLSYVIQPLQNGQRLTILGLQGLRPHPRHLPLE